MRNIFLAAALSLVAVPVLAGGSFDLPRLDWPTDTTVTTSTKGCVQTLDGAAPDATLCQ